MAESTLAQNSSFTLTASSPLDSHSTIVDGASVEEISTLSMVSVAPFAGNETGFQSAIAKLFGCGPTSATIAFERFRKQACLFLPSAHGQWFLCFNHDVGCPVTKAISLLGKDLLGKVAITEQSDSWVVLALNGLLVRRTLERICPIDCSASAMPVGTTARTVIEHLGAIIVRRPNDSDGNPCFWLFSSRSSAASFLKAITASPPFTK